MFTEKQFNFLLDGLTALEDFKDQTQQDGIEARLRNAFHFEMEKLGKEGQIVNPEEFGKIGIPIVEEMQTKHMNDLEEITLLKAELIKMRNHGRDEETKRQQAVLEKHFG